jgi:hypothetical protein
MTPKQLEFVNEALKETVTRWKRKKPNGPWWRRVLAWLRTWWDVMDDIEEERVRVPRECPECEEPMRVHAIVALPVYDDLTPGTSQEGTMPLIAMICDRCGGVELFNAYAIGVVGAHGHIKEAK